MTRMKKQQERFNSGNKGGTWGKGIAPQLIARHTERCKKKRERKTETSPTQKKDQKGDRYPSKKSTKKKGMGGSRKKKDGSRAIVKSEKNSQRKAEGKCPYKAEKEHKKKKLERKKGYRCS